MADTPGTRAGGWFLVEIQIVRVRPDGSRIEAAEIGAHLEQLRVPANILDGIEIKSPELIVVMFVSDEGDRLVTAEVSPHAGQEIEDFIPELMRHFDTITLVNGGQFLVDGNGNYYDDEIPDAVEARIELVPDGRPAPVVHVISSHDPLFPTVVASIADEVVEIVDLGSVTVVRDATGLSSSAVSELATKRDLPALSITRGIGWTDFEGAVRIARRMASFEMSAWRVDGSIVGTGTDEELHSFLLRESGVAETSKRRLPPGLREELVAAVSDHENPVEQVLRVLGLPLEIAAWVDGDSAPGSVRLVQPKEPMKIVGSVYLDPDMVEYFESSTPVYGRMWRFFRLHPWVGLSFGLFELTVAVLFLTVARSEIALVVALLAGFVWGLDGIVHTGLALIRLFRGRRDN